MVSPYARSHAVTNMVHDHTSVLATIERQWNLPALTYRDANAATLADFLDTSAMTFAEPPDLAAPANPLPGLLQGYQGQPVPRPPPPPDPDAERCRPSPGLGPGVAPASHLASHPGGAGAYSG